VRGDVPSLPCRHLLMACLVDWCGREPIAKGLCNAHYLRKLRGLPLDDAIQPRYPKGMLCLFYDCGKPLDGKGGSGYCAKHYKRWQRVERWERLVALFGGRCQRCLQSFPACVYDFHHKDPSTKSFTIGQQIVNKSFEEILAEAQKCDLLCANCHRLNHFGSYEWPHLTRQLEPS